MELAIAWIYQVDGSIQPPDRTSLATMIADPALVRILGSTITQRMNTIRSQGNLAVHNRGAITESDAVRVVGELFEVSLWIARTYSLNTNNLPGLDISFDSDLIPDRNPAIPVAENLPIVRTEIPASVSEDAVVDIRSREDSETLDLVVDVLLEGAGWASDDSITRNYRISEPNLLGSKSATVDYVLWDDDGKPLALVEIKEAAQDFASSTRQAQIYADRLEETFDQRPIVFYTDGNVTYIWDDVQNSPREIQGFYAKDEIRRLIRRKQNYRPLTEIPVDELLVNRPYQHRAIRRTCEAFEDDRQRRALLSMAQGSGKGLVAVALVDLLVRAGRVHRVLFLADRALIVQQTVDMFNTHLPNLPVVSRLREEHSSGRVHIATYQTMLALMNEVDEFGLRKFGPGYFDLIIIGEAISGYRQYSAIVEHFDSTVLAFTSAPKDAVDPCIYELFNLADGMPTDSYELADAISEGYAIAPNIFDIQFTSSISDEMHMSTVELDINESGKLMVDAAKYVDADDINRFLFSVDAIDNMLETLIRDGVRGADGVLVGKTIIFAKSIQHAQIIAERFNERYPQLGHDFAKSITSRNLDSHRLISQFADSDEMPRIAISSGLLDTGIDIPAVVNLVFFKPVRSKSLFWQMLARGSRVAPNLFGPNRHKTQFNVFDYCRNFEFARIEGM